MDSTRERLVKRLEELRKEYTGGGQMLESLDREREDLRSTVLRIEGAIQVLEEELASSREADQDATEGAAHDPAPSD